MRDKLFSERSLELLKMSKEIWYERKCTPVKVELMFLRLSFPTRASQICEKKHGKLAIAVINHHQKDKPHVTFSESRHPLAEK